VLVVPESINPGWRARSADGTQLTAIVVNGWQQGWVVPAGTDGAITLSFAFNGLYRAGLFTGLALLPLLALLALLPARRRLTGDPARTWRPGPLLAGAGALALGTVISGLPGAVVVGVALGGMYLLRRREPLRDRLTVLVTAGALILAGTALAQHPWRAVDGYAGHDPGVQLLALISVATLAAAAAVAQLRGPGAPRSDDAASARPARTSPPLALRSGPDPSAE